MGEHEIRETDALTDAEREQLFGWGDDIFELAALGLTYRPKDLHLLLYADGCLVSHAALLTHTVEVDGANVKVAGLGGVVTIPSVQRRGYGRAVVSHAMDLVRSWNLDALLFCIAKRIPFYEKLGCRLVEGQVLVEQPLGPVVTPFHAMVWPERLRSARRIRLNSLPW